VRSTAAMILAIKNLEFRIQNPPNSKFLLPNS
jgi:hypothetical protein